MLGALARLGLLELAGPDRATATLLAINVVGSGLLGILVGSVTGRHPWLRPFAGTGVLGGFTTYSAAVAATVELADGASWLGPAIYLAGGILVSVLAAAAGLALGESLRRRRRPAAGRAPAPVEESAP